jgi:PleD family two-component response regulator
VAERIVHGFASSPLQLSEQQLSALISVSVGIAWADPDSGEDLTDTLLTGRADQALYQSKHAGRSCYTSHRMSPC